MTAVASERLRASVEPLAETTRCAVVVVNYGSHGLLEQNLVPLHRGAPELDVVVVDNFTTNAERAHVQQLVERNGWTLVAVDTNLGFGAGANRGARAAFAHGADQLLLLNPDATIAPDAVSRLRARVVAEPMTLVAPTVRTPEGALWFAGSAVNLTTGMVRSTYLRKTLGDNEIPWLSGACLLVSRQLWEHVGGFDEKYFLYWEDVDLSYRVQAVGGHVEVLADAVAIHAQGGTQHTRSARAKSDTYYRHMVRGRLLFAGAHLSPVGRARWLAGAPAYAWRVVLHGGRRQLLHSASPVLAGARGVLDGAPVALRGASRRTSRRLTVLQSVPRPLPTTNPYNIMLADALADRPDIDLRMFSWREALLHRHDVFHAHWPESLIVRRGAVKTHLRRGLFSLLLVKWRLTGTAVVRTMHNLEMPSGIGEVETWQLSALDRMTAGRIALNPFTHIPGASPTQTVLHGHYRPWFAGHDVPPVEPGRLAYFGMIRRYKGVETLVRAFHELDRDDLNLVIAGRPSSAELAADIERSAEADPRISFSFDFLQTDELVHHVGRAELVILPHTEMHNSGSAIAALSLDRPVLMQDTEVNRWLSAEVGPGWVHLYDELTSAAVSTALDELRAAPPQGRPDLSARDWPRAAELHTDLYRAAKGARRRILHAQRTNS